MELKRPHRSALTLVEVLIALTMSLIVLSVMTAAFKYVSDEMAKGRAAIEMSNRLRTAEQLLRNDLAGITVDVRPWNGGASPSGYFEYVEGLGHDRTGTYLGDIDDILAMTVRSRGRPFIGRFGGGLVESSLAEVVWFTVHRDRNQNGVVDYDENVELCRRVLLIRPDLDDDLALWTAVTGDEYSRNTNDISIGHDGGANSLADLAKRENRFARAGGPSGFPHQLRAAGFNHSLARDRHGETNELGVLELTGEDILLSELVAFDLRVFAPDTSASIVDGIYVGPSDHVLAGQSSFGRGAHGAYVDLGDGDGAFSGDANPKSRLHRTYCTWSPHYESDGYNQDAADDDREGHLTLDAVPKTDEGTNGLDDDLFPGQGVDDAGERETMPPYPTAIRGFRATFRLVEKVSKQVRQSSVVFSFVPE